MVKTLCMEMKRKTTWEFSISLYLDLAFLSYCLYFTQQFDLVQELSWCFDFFFWSKLTQNELLLEWGYQILSQSVIFLSVIF